MIFFLIFGRYNESLLFVWCSKVHFCGSRSIDAHNVLVVWRKKRSKWVQAKFIMLFQLLVAHFHYVYVFCYLFGSRMARKKYLLMGNFPFSISTDVLRYNLQILQPCIWNFPFGDNQLWGFFVTFLMPLNFNRFVVWGILVLKHHRNFNWK